jgi:hypothetical protein
MFIGGRRFWAVGMIYKDGVIVLPTHVKAKEIFVLYLCTGIEDR